MNWMFWKKEGQTQKLPGPKEIPPPIGSYLVTQEGMSPDVVWKLMAAISPRLNDKYVVDVRVRQQQNKTGWIQDGKLSLLGRSP